VNESLEIEGILRTMFDPRNNLANEVSAQLIMHFGDKVFRTIIPRNIRLAEAPSFWQACVVSRQGVAGCARLPGTRWRDDPQRGEELEQVASAATTVASGITAPSRGHAGRHCVHDRISRRTRCDRAGSGRCTLGQLIE